MQILTWNNPPLVSVGDIYRQQRPLVEATAVSSADHQSIAETVIELADHTVCRFRHENKLTHAISYKLKSYAKHLHQHQKLVDIKLAAIVTSSVPI